VTGGILEITGDDRPNTIALVGDPGTDTVNVDVGGDGTIDFTFPRSAFTAVRAMGNGGSDTLRADNSLFFLDEPLTLNGGPGNDTLIGGPNADLLKGGTGDDFADGNIGHDTADLGDGNDRYQWDPGDGSDDVNGEEGTDALLFNGSNAGEKVDLSANGSAVRLTRDVAAITMNLTGIQRLRLRTLGSADTVTVNDLSGTKLTDADIDLGAFGGGGDGAVDTVIANGTPGADHPRVGLEDGQPVVAGLHPHIQIANAEPVSDQVDVEGLGGDDTLTAGVGAAGVRAFDFDGGEGDDALTYSGTNGPDAIGIARDGATTEGAFRPGGALVDAEPSVEHFLVQGLAGADAITGQNGLADLTPLHIEGGKGDDQLDGGDGADVIVGGDGADHIDGNRGTDTELGSDQGDTFQWDPGDGSDTLEGQSGADTFDFNGSNAGERVSVFANGPRVTLNRDVALITQDFAGIERLQVRLLGSSDVLTVGDLTGTDLSDVGIDLSSFDGVTGDGAADALFLDGTDGPDDVHVATAGTQVVTTGLPARTTITGSEPNLDALEVETRGGDDTADVAQDVSTLINVVVDLGADEGP
jgi:hypothetical protein